MSKITAIIILICALHFISTFAQNQNNVQGELKAVLTFHDQPPSVASLQSYTEYILEHGWNVENVEYGVNQFKQYISDSETSFVQGLVYGENNLGEDIIYASLISGDAEDFAEFSNNISFVWDAAHDITEVFTQN